MPCSSSFEHLLAGLTALAADGKPAVVTEVACWAHVRRIDVHKATGSVIAREASDRIGAWSSRLRDVLSRIGNHPINRVDELLPWHWADSARADKLAA